jgi:hypothetical protein
MKIKKGYRLRPLGKEYILVAEGLDVMDANTMVSMNATAAFLWEAVEGKEFDTETLVQLLLDEYDVDHATAEKDVKALLQTWNKANVIED